MSWKAFHHLCYCYHYRRHKQRQAIYMADDGQAPPLYCKASPALLWGSMYGTEHLDPSGLRKWKATAVRNTLAFLGSLQSAALMEGNCGKQHLFAVWPMVIPLGCCLRRLPLSLLKSAFVLSYATCLLFPGVCNQLLGWTLVQSLQGLLQLCLL